MSDFRGLLLVLFLTVVSGYWVLLSEHAGCQQDKTASRNVSKLKTTLKKKRAKKGTK